MVGDCEFEFATGQVLNLCRCLIINFDLHFSALFRRNCLKWYFETAFEGAGERVQELFGATVSIQLVEPLLDPLPLGIKALLVLGPLHFPDCF